MTQKTSPFLGVAYGWDFGESGWNGGMDENLIKFSYLLNRNIDGIVASLPPAVAGQAFFLTTDNRVYYSTATTYYSSSVPKYFEFKLRSTGQTYLFDGTALVIQDDISSKANSGANSDITSLIGLTTPLSVSQGGTGQNTPLTKSNVGLSNVDNTSDVNKPVSALQATAISSATSQKTTYLNTLASVRSLDSTKVTYCTTNGYYTPGDGGGADYYYDPADTTTPDDGGGTIVASDNARWKLVPSGGRINVRSFGARGIPLSTDDTAFFVKAQQYAVITNSTLYVSPLTTPYITDSMDVICNLVTDGALLKRKVGGTGPWLNIKANNASLSGFSLDGSWVVGNGIEVDGFADVSISDNTFSSIGGQILHFNAANRLLFTRNYVASATNGITNLMPAGSATAAISSGVVISYNTIESLAGSGIYFAGKVLTSDPLYYLSNPLILEATVQGNVLKNILGHGFICQGKHVSIIGNSVINAGNASGLQSIVPQGEMITVVGNVCEGGSGVGIDMGGCKNSTVSGNTVRSKGEIGIEMNSCTNVSCTGNTITECGSTVTGTNSAGISVSQGFFGGSLTSFGVTVIGNTVTAGSAGGKYGISVDASVANTVVSGNHLIASGTVAPLYIGTGSKALAYGNLLVAGEEPLLATYGTDMKVAARSSTGNTDLWLSPQGTGQLRVDKFMTTATTPANFSAKAYLPIKDQAGNLFYIPVTNVTW